MPALRELQADMRAALLGAGDAPAAAAVLDDGLDASGRLAIYRHHVFATLTDVLKATYPVVCRLADERFFGWASDQYIREHPPAGPCLFEYGGTFADFLAAFPPCRELVYLPDVARLEWAMSRAESAADALPLDAHTLASVDPANTPRLRFTLDPSYALLESPWPVDRIWRANQPDADPDATVDLATGGVRLEIRRVGDDVVFRALDPATFAFRRALAAGDTLGDAAVAALRLGTAFDLGCALRLLLDEGALTSFTPSPMETPS
ncbi:MAG: DNA-binding domain-containing protein [Candidatus Rokuibacteriota bacterium]